MNLYETLGVEPDAGADAIKSAYRREAMKHHPDRGGDPDKFKAVQQAHEVLGNEERRAAYDATGETGAPDMLRQKAEQLVASTLMSLLAKVDEETSMSMWDLANSNFGNGSIVSDPIMSAASAISQAITKNLQEQEKARKAIRRMGRSLMRISRRGSGPNLVKILLEQQIKDSEVFLVTAAEEHKVFCLASEILSDYRYDRSAGERRQVTPDSLRLGV